MIDIHSHVLPEMDDGSESVEESIALLSLSWKQGIRGVAATPHFYAAENNPTQFLERRGESLKQLQAAWQPNLPELFLGAEVYYFEGMSYAEELPLLRLEGSNLLLVEMPFAPWTERMIDDVLDIPKRSNCRVILAHIERYMRWQKASVWEKMLENGVLFQCNASFFLHWNTRHKALKMLRQGRVHFLGSDCHNLRSRPPRLANALQVIGPEGQQILERNIKKYFPDGRDTP